MQKEFQGLLCKSSLTSCSFMAARHGGVLLSSPCSPGLAPDARLALEEATPPRHSPLLSLVPHHPCCSDAARHGRRAPHAVVADRALHRGPSLLAAEEIRPPRHSSALPCPSLLTARSPSPLISLPPPELQPELAVEPRPLLEPPRPDRGPPSAPPHRPLRPRPRNRRGAP